MKNLKVLLGLLLIGLIGCDPYTDEFESIEEANQVINKNIAITLEEDDYELSGIESAANFGNFSSEEDVRAGIPAILNAKYPYINGEGSLAEVTYKFYNGSSPYLGSGEAYTVTSEEYEALGFGFGNFSDLPSDIPVYASYKAPDASNGDYLDITHDYYNGSFVESDIVSRAVYTSAYGWQYATVLPEDVYGDFFGEGGIDFSNEDEGEEKMPVYLNYLVNSAPDYDTQTLEAGEVLVVQYNYDGGDGAENTPSVGLYIFDGTEWSLYSEGYQTTQETLSFGYDGSTWVPDNTIAITLPFSAYEFMAAQLPADDPRRGSMESFGNFDVRQGESVYWDIPARVQVIGAWLLAEYPDSEVGQKYKVTYAVYDGAAGTREITLILNESGEYEEFTE